MPAQGKQHSHKKLVSLVEHLEAAAKSCSTWVLESMTDDVTIGFLHKKPPKVVVEQLWYAVQQACWDLSTSGRPTSSQFSALQSSREALNAVIRTTAEMQTGVADDDHASDGTNRVDLTATGERNMEKILLALLKLQFVIHEMEKEHGIPDSEHGTPDSELTGASHEKTLDGAGGVEHSRKTPTTLTSWVPATWRSLSLGSLNGIHSESARPKPDLGVTVTGEAVTEQMPARADQMDGGHDLDTSLELGSKVYRRSWNSAQSRAPRTLLYGGRAEGLSSLQAHNPSQTPNSSLSARLARLNNNAYVLKQRPGYSGSNSNGTHSVADLPTGNHAAPQWHSTETPTRWGNGLSSDHAEPTPTQNPRPRSVANRLRAVAAAEGV